MPSCSAPACTHSGRNCKLFRFPSDIVRRKIWIKNCGRSFATTTHRLCQHHFRKRLVRMKGNRQVLARNAVPTIFDHTYSRKKSKDSTKINMRCGKINNEKTPVETSNFVSQLKISDCWSEKQKFNAKRELLNVLYEDSNPLDDDVTESDEPSMNNQPLGLENIPIVGSDISSESNIEFSYSTPKKLNDLSPIFAKWSPKNNNVVSIIEDLIDSSDDDESRNDEETSSNHVIYIDEDSVKQEEFVDENSEESFDSESNRNSRKDKEELNYSFDENKVLRQFHITDTLRVKLHKLNIDGKFTNNYESNSTSQSKSNGILNEKTTTKASNEKKKLPNKSLFSKKTKNRKTSQSNQRRKVSHSNAKSKRVTSPELKLQSKARNHSNNQRQSLRLSGKSPEIKLPDYVPSMTRSGKKRIYEEPKSKSTNAPHIYTIDDDEMSHPTSKIQVKEEPKSEVTSQLRSRSPSPSTYRKNIEVFFVCQCCNEKYESVEKVKVHVRAHFPNCATN